MKVTVFDSWQSDTKAAANRTLIQAALESAVKELRADGSISVEPVIERDTKGVPGAPDIDATIFKKIEAGTVMVADVTIVGRSGGGPTPNPNVLVELGYAFKVLGWKRIVLVQNVAFGPPEELPFDLRQKRVLTYSSAEDAPERAPERRRLLAELKEALALVLANADIRPVTTFPAELSIEYQKVKIRSERHDYQLQVRLKNAGTRPITEWHVDVSMPTRLLESGTIFAARVPERSNWQQTLFRGTQKTRGGAIYPGDTRLVLTIDYYVDDALYEDLRGLFDECVTAIAYVHGEIATTAERFVRDIQIF